MAKMKLTLIQKREWSKVDNGTGDTIEKTFYAGFPEKGKPMEFATRPEMEHEIHEGTLKYDSNLAEEIDIIGIFDSFKGVMKYVEAGSQGKEL